MEEEGGEEEEEDKEERRERGWRARKEEAATAGRWIQANLSSGSVKLSGQIHPYRKPPNFERPLT